jgi:hypothetical protein
MIQMQANILELTRGTSFYRAGLWSHLPQEPYMHVVDMFIPAELAGSTKSSLGRYRGAMGMTVYKASK